MKPLFVVTYPEIDPEQKVRFMEALKDLGSDRVIRIPADVAVELVNVRPLSKYWRRRWAWLRRRSKAPRLDVKIQMAAKVEQVEMHVTVGT